MTWRDAVVLAGRSVRRRLGRSALTVAGGALAAALLTAGHRLSYIEHRAGRSWFVFDADARIAATAARYFTSNLTVDARSFADTLRALKAALHAAPVQTGATGAGVAA